MLLKTLIYRASLVSQTLPLRIIIVVPFLLQIFVAVGLTGWLSVRHGQQAVKQLVTQLKMEVSDRTHQQLDQYFALPHQLTQMNLEAIESKLLNPGVIAEYFENVTILFADIVGFTPLSSRLSPIKLVNLLNQIFSCFDQLAQHHGLEKIKTIGDAYMVASGLPLPRADHAQAIAEMALDMQQAITQFTTDTDEPFQMRIGIHTGAVVAGVIGMNKFVYDLWGDTVNVASRMESQGLAGSIQVTQATYDQLHGQYRLEKRGVIEVKGKGKMMTYWLIEKC